MSVKLKPIDQQVIFITGATSGIGLATVRMALNKGAKVYMVGGNEDELQKIQDEMRIKNRPTAYAVADVSEVDQLQIAADHCLETFGRIDTWINNVGVSIHASLYDTNETETKLLFDTNFWGVVNGCNVASTILRRQGGTIINIGSFFSEARRPTEGVYLAFKQAVKGYTNTLKHELSHGKTPVSVSVIMPDRKDSNEIVAKMILKRAVTPTVKEVATSMWSKSRLMLKRNTFLNKLKIISPR